MGVEVGVCAGVIVTPIMIQVIYTRGLFAALLLFISGSVFLHLFFTSKFTFLHNEYAKFPGLFDFPANGSKSKGAVAESVIHQIKHPNNTT